jgi:hypothetical protein
LHAPNFAKPQRRKLPRTKNRKPKAFAQGKVITLAKPPIFPGPPIDADPLQHLHRARQFRAAAAGLADYVNGEQNWPKYALVTHAIELTLKGFVLHFARGARVPGDPKRHDLAGWYEAAVSFGLEREPTIEQNVALLNELHESHYLRYPKRSARAVPDLGVMADHTVDHLLFDITQVVNPR